MKSKILAIAMIIVIIASMIFIPASAASINQIPVNTTDAYYSQAFYNSAAPIGFLSGGGDVRIAAYQNNTYVYAIPKPTRGTILDYNLYTLSTNENPNKPGMYALTFGANLNWASGPSGHYTTTYNDTAIYYFYIETSGPNNQTMTIDTSSEYVKVVNSFEEACQDLLYGQPVTNQVTFSLPAGNVAYIQLGSHFSGFKLSAEMPTVSYLIGSSPWPDANQMWGFTNTLPSTGDYTPFGSIVSWSKSGATNILGQTKNAFFEPTGPFQNSTYLVIYNPLYSNEGNERNDPYLNPSITVYVNDAIELIVYPITSILSTNTGIGGGLVINTATSSETQNGSIDPGTGNITWTDKNGDPSTGPQTGGGNSIIEGQTVLDVIKNLAENISSFFTGSINAVNTLISTISQFTSSIKSLYMWLPGPVYSLLTSAIMLAITIGVIKIFI